MESKSLQGICIQTDHMKINSYQREGKLEGWDSQLNYCTEIDKTARILLYNTGECIQYLVLTYNGIESKKITSHYAVHLKLT